MTQSHVANESEGAPRGAKVAPPLSSKRLVDSSKIFLQSWEDLPSQPHDILSQIERHGGLKNFYTSRSSLEAHHIAHNERLVSVNVQLKPACAG